MDTSFQKKRYESTDEWLTPKYIIDSLGEFDLDPCAPSEIFWLTAEKHYVKADDGLSLPWEGRIWLNPPYSRPLINKFLEKMAHHNNGIALIFARTDTKLFHDLVFDKASALLFMKGRIKFYNLNGEEGGTPGIGSVLVAYDNDRRRFNTQALINSGIEGKLIFLK